MFLFLSYRKIRISYKCSEQCQTGLPAGRDPVRRTDDNCCRTRPLTSFMMFWCSRHFYGRNVPNRVRNPVRRRNDNRSFDGDSRCRTNGRRRDEVSNPVRNVFASFLFVGRGLTTPFMTFCRRAVADGRNVSNGVPKPRPETKYRERKLSAYRCLLFRSLVSRFVLFPGF